MLQSIKTMSRNEVMQESVGDEECELLLILRQFARRLQVSIDMVYKLVREGKLDAVHIGRVSIFRMHEHETSGGER